MNEPDDLNNLTKDQKDALSGVYEENCALMRRHQSQRATASNIVILTTAGLVSLMVAVLQAQQSDHSTIREENPR